MRRVLEVVVGNDAHRVGLLRHEAQGARESASFEYDPEWLKRADRFALDPLLRLVAGPQFHKRAAGGSLFHGAIADTEPDGWARQVILRDHAKRRQAARRDAKDVPSAALHELDFLLAVDDMCRVGALRFRDEAGKSQRAAEPGRRTAPPLIELSRLLASTRAVETHSETAADLAYLRGRGTSLGGLRPKCNVIDDDGSLSIAKFPSVADERAVTKGEVLGMKLAARAKLSVAEARLVQSEDIPVTLVRRFDRQPTGGRLMYVSAATMLGAVPSSEHSYTEIVDALRVHGAASQADIDELFRRVAFSIAINNVDDHLHNHGFLHVEKGKWRLAPAFDLNPFPDRARELKTWISEETGPEASFEALMSVAPYFRIKMPRAEEIAREVREAVAHWRDIGRTIGMTTDELDSFADAFEPL